MTAAQLELLARNYFDQIRNLRQGNPASVAQLMDLWSADGTFDFCGASPVMGTYKGTVAIQTLYKNRLNSNGMPLTLETTNGVPEDVTLGLVDTQILNVRTNGDRAIVGWRTTIGTPQGFGFDVAGAHHFVFDDTGKIASLRVTISPKADAADSELGLSLSELTVTDVGRLSLAAWPVV